MFVERFSSVSWAGNDSFLQEYQANLAWKPQGTGIKDDFFDARRKFLLVSGLDRHFPVQVLGHPLRLSGHVVFNEQAMQHLNTQ